jgi:Tol biopolymer transport system component
VWSPDGRALAYAAGNGHAWVASTGEPRPPEPLAPFPEQGVAFEPSSWSPDGSSLAGTSGGIVVYDLEHRRYRRLTDTGERPIWVGGTHLLFVDGDRIRCVDTRRGERRDVWTVSPNRLLPEGDSSSTLRT